MKRSLTGSLHNKQYIFKYKWKAIVYIVVLDNYTLLITFVNKLCHLSVSPWLGSDISDKFVPIKLTYI